MTAQTQPSAVEAQVRMQAEAWQAVVAVLDEVAPNWWDSDATGTELAVSTIRALAASQEAPKADEHVRRQVGRLAKWLACLSYNESYVGEPAGEFKSAIRELSKAVDPIYPPDPEPEPSRVVHVGTFPLPALAPRAEAVDAPAPAVEADDLPREGETEDDFVIRRLSSLLAEIAVIVKGPEPALTSWSYHDLPDLVRALKARVPPVRNLPLNPPPAKPVRVVVTHEVASRGPDWLREDMLTLADGVERGEITGVLWPETIREWVAALANAAPPEADRTAGENAEARAMVARAVEGWKVYEEGGYQVVAHHPDFGEVRGDTRSPRLANWALVVTLRDVIATTKPLNNLTRLLATAPIKAEALAAPTPPASQGDAAPAGDASQLRAFADRIDLMLNSTGGQVSATAWRLMAHEMRRRADGNGGAVE